MKKIVILLTILVAALIIGLIYLLYSKGFITPGTNSENALIETGIGPTKPPIDDNVKDKRIKVDGVSMGNIKSGVVKAENFKFVPDQMAVNQGDTVTITFTNTQGLHDFTIDEFKVKSKTLEAGETEEITFVADKKGTFEFYCSIGQHRAMGMVGTITVQ